VAIVLRLAWIVILVTTASTVGCSDGLEIVPLLGTAGIPLTPTTTAPLEVVTRSTAVADPLPVRGTSVAYGDIEAAMGHAVASATVPWASNHRGVSPKGEGWQLFVEITNSDAQYEDGRVIFTVGVRATLRARAGNVYLAQSQASCRQGGLVPSTRGAPVMYRCMMEIGHDLAGWLDGVDLDSVAASK
jgi:hypothetical protein